jgi:hypothetical protein
VLLVRRARPHRDDPPALALAKVGFLSGHRRVRLLR